MKTTYGEQHTYAVEKKRTEAPGITTLFLRVKDGAVPAYAPGQFINVFFPETNTPEGKAYSISSAVSEGTFTITVRAIGEFSNRLSAMEAGDTFSGSLPYGFFYPERETSDVVMLASGIGVTPFRSMIRTAADKTPARRMTLLHSVRTAKDAIFREEFGALREKLPKLTADYFVTRGSEMPFDAKTRRMGAKDALQHVDDLQNTEFLLCGSISFTRDMWRDLKHHGVSEDAIYTEAFFSH